MQSLGQREQEIFLGVGRAFKAQSVFVSRIMGPREKSRQDIINGSRKAQTDKITH